VSDAHFLVACSEVIAGPDLLRPRVSGKPGAVGPPLDDLVAGRVASDSAHCVACASPKPRPAMNSITNRPFCCEHFAITQAMLNLFSLWPGALVRLFRHRGSLVLENLVLRQQLAVLKRRRLRPQLGLLDKLSWVGVRRSWSGWKEALVVVTSDTVVRWRRAGFRFYWRVISKARQRMGRRQTPKADRSVIFRMVHENPRWGALRIHGERFVLGFDVSERTISRWMKRATRDPEPAGCWLAFLRNHREAITAMDFFTVPTITFCAIQVFFVIADDRRRILHFNVTKHPTSLWLFNSSEKLFCSDRLPVLDHRPGREVWVRGSLGCLLIEHESEQIAPVSNSSCKRPH